jgi:hypothetical protein
MQTLFCDCSDGGGGNGDGGDGDAQPAERLISRAQPGGGGVRTWGVMERE